MQTQRFVAPVEAGRAMPAAIAATGRPRRHATHAPPRASTCTRSASHIHPTVMGAAVLSRVELDQSPQAMQAPPQEILPKTYQCLGLAQAMVDFTASVQDGVLSSPPFNVGRGLRRVISLQERHECLQALDDLGCESQVSPGGSLANTLVAISRLAHAHGSTTRVGMTGAVGVDTLGCYFNAQLKQAGVEVLVDQDNLSHTGTVMVLTTPDAQRSFLSFFDSGSARLTPTMAAAVAGSEMVVIEGYMLEMPGADNWVLEVARLAQRAGAQLVLTCGDPTVVSRHRAILLTLLHEGLVNVLFCNKEEACELMACQPDDTHCTGTALATALAAYAPMVVVTDGSRGACLGHLGQVFEVPPHWAPKGPVDVCGAGDAYAAGIIYGVSCGYDLETAGRFAARVAAAVISRHGAQLAPEDARELVQWLPDHVGVHWPASPANPQFSKAVPGRG